MVFEPSVQLLDIVREIEKVDLNVHRKYAVGKCFLPAPILLLSSCDSARHVRPEAIVDFPVVLHRFYSFKFSHVSSARHVRPEAIMDFPYLLSTAAGSVHRC